MKGINMILENPLKKMECIDASDINLGSRSLADIGESLSRLMNADVDIDKVVDYAAVKTEAVYTEHEENIKDIIGDGNDLLYDYQKPNS